MLVRTNQPIEVGTVLYIDIRLIKRMGTATVRHCTRRRSKFLIGLEFNGQLQRSP
jgi:hypothetical protein